jgi:hypothetical protein
MRRRADRHPPVTPGWDGDADESPAARLIRGADGAAVCGRDGCDDGQSQARSSFVAALVGLCEALERPGEKRVRESGPFVAHVQLDRPRSTGRGEVDLTGAMAQRVLDEVGQSVLEARAIALEREGLLAGDVDRAAVPAGALPEA